MPKYNVCVTRTSSRSLWVTVDAISRDRARQKAIDEAGNINFAEAQEEGDADYHVYELYAVEEVKDGSTH